MGTYEIGRVNGTLNRKFTDVSRMSSELCHFTFEFCKFLLQMRLKLRVRSTVPIWKRADGCKLPFASCAWKISDATEFLVHEILDCYQDLFSGRSGLNFEMCNDFQGSCFVSVSCVLIEVMGSYRIFRTSACVHVDRILKFQCICADACRTLSIKN